MILIDIFIVLVFGILCINGENMPKKQMAVMEKNATKSEASSEDNNSRYARSFDGPWVPSYWNPYHRAPMHTFWAAPWHHETHAIVDPYPLHHHVKHHEYHHKPIHHHKPVYVDYHHPPHHHKPTYDGPIPPPPPHHLPNQHATYIAVNPGAIHIAPLLGHAESVYHLNVGPGPLPPIPVVDDVAFGPLLPVPPPPPPPPVPAGPLPAVPLPGDLFLPLASTPARNVAPAPRPSPSPRTW